jgi:hypothetical protein
MEINRQVLEKDFKTNFEIDNNYKIQLVVVLQKIV